MQPGGGDQRGPDPNVNVCEQPPVRGRCRGNFVRFYFDTNAGICRDFSYGGCDANGNNFERLEDCERECRPGEHRESVCLLKLYKEL